MPTDGGIRFGPYVLLRRIARGGMAEVFLAQQHGLEGFDRRVAVKRILPHLADLPDFVKMFLTEARLAAQLTHPNIVHIYDFGKVEGDYFIAMEYVDGIHCGRLSRQQDGERLPPALVARVGADAANALHHAHALSGPSGAPIGLVHRDVSPANIMVSYDGGVKLCDFGIAKAVAAATSSPLTSPGEIKGKFAYMSPEQTLGTPLDGRSDVFSLGVCLWELIVGLPFVPRGDVVEAMRMIREGRFPPVSQVAPATPPPLAKAIGRALEIDRDKRATAGELAQALEAFIKSAPELATSMQLATWVRARFSREVGADAADATEVVGTAAAPATSGYESDDEHQQTIAIESTLPDPPYATDEDTTLKPFDTPLTDPTRVVESAFDLSETIARPPIIDDEGPSQITTRASAPAMFVPPPRRAPARPSWLVLGLGAAGIVLVVIAVVIGSRGSAPVVMDAAPAAVVASIDAPIALAPPVADAFLPTVPPTWSVDIRTEPDGALVTVGDRRHTAPAHFDLPAGHYQITAELPGWTDETREVDLGPPRGAELDIAFATRSPSTSRTGKLSVRTAPPSHVFDGTRDLGTSPFSDLVLPAGTYTLTFEAPGHPATTRTVTIFAGKITKLSFTLK